MCYGFAVEMYTIIFDIFCLDAPNIESYGSYLHYICLNDLPYAQEQWDVPVLDVRLDLTTISQFFGVQKLPEHYHPSSLAFSEYLN